MAVITSRQHASVKAFRAVAHGRDDARALIDGWHLLHDAAAAGMTVETVAVVGNPSRPDDVALIDRLGRTAEVIPVSSAVMNALSPVRAPSGVVALVRRRPHELGELLTPAPPLIVVAIDIQDPGNAGAMIRSAEAGGATGVVFAGMSADPWTWKSLRAAMGSTFRLPVRQQEDAVVVCDTLRRAGVTLFATVPDHGVRMDRADLRGAAALLFGGEGGGLDASVLAQADVQLSIPMRPPCESLNVAVAAGVLVYEARRQRVHHA